jgi:hypothetical protein
LLQGSGGWLQGILLFNETSPRRGKGLSGLLMMANKRVLYVFDKDDFSLVNPHHWEGWKGKIYVYDQTEKYHHAMIYVPMDIVRHLKVEHKSLIQIAIQRRDENDARK